MLAGALNGLNSRGRTEHSDRVDRRLTGFSDAIAVPYPKTKIQRCTVQQIADQKLHAYISYKISRHLRPCSSPYTSIRTGGYNFHDIAIKHPAVLYGYQPDRRAKHSATFLRSFKGYCYADGDNGYHVLPERITVVGCWSHAGRKWNEALKALSG